MEENEPKDLDMEDREDIMTEDPTLPDLPSPWGNGTRPFDLYFGNKTEEEISKINLSHIET